MVATAKSNPKKAAVSMPKANKNGKSSVISWADFQRRYLDREDGFKYEWVNRQVSKSKHIDYTQSFILRNLMEFFILLKTSKGIQGLLQSETDIFFDGNHRRPDICFLTNHQIARTAHGINQIPAFVIEIISTKDQMNLVHEKMEDYRRAGVEVVWHIFPKLGQVHVFSGKSLKIMHVCIGEDLCNAASVIEGFEMAADAVFEKPPMPAD